MARRRIFSPPEDTVQKCRCLLFCCDAIGRDAIDRIAPLISAKPRHCCAWDGASFSLPAPIKEPGQSLIEFFLRRRRPGEIVQGLEATFTRECRGRGGAQRKCAKRMTPLTEFKYAHLSQLARLDGPRNHCGRAVGHQHLLIVQQRRLDRSGNLGSDTQRTNAGHPRREWKSPGCRWDGFARLARRGPRAATGSVRSGHQARPWRVPSNWRGRL